MNVSRALAPEQRFTNTRACKSRVPLSRDRLGEPDQTRIWNLMIEVIAQSGRYPPNASSELNTVNPLANFVVEGEQRYWVHVAIDRFTGEVIDRQVEVVNE